MNIDKIHSLLNTLRDFIKRKYCFRVYRNRYVNHLNIDSLMDSKLHQVHSLRIDNEHFPEMKIKHCFIYLCYCLSRNMESNNKFKVKI